MSSTTGPRSRKKIVKEIVIFLCVRIEKVIKSDIDLCEKCGNKHVDLILKYKGFMPKIERLCA